jgi:hypothetical protein
MLLQMLGEPKAKVIVIATTNAGIQKRCELQMI